jgi:very-short-patch-repair endonuclease
MIKKARKRKSLRKRFKNGTSKVETRICNLLGGEKLKLKGKNYDIVLEDKKVVIEIDGDYWHPRKLQKLTLLQIGNYINDREKQDIIAESEYTLYRILTSKLRKKKKIDLQFIIDNACLAPLTIGPKDIIVSKEYIEKNKGKFTNLSVAKIIKFFKLTINKDIHSDTCFKTIKSILFQEIILDLTYDNVLNYSGVI